jgi:hypothetical protein
MLISWYRNLEDYKSQLACVKRVFWAALYQSHVGKGANLSKRSIKAISYEIGGHEKCIRMLHLLEILGLEKALLVDRKLHE